MLSQLSMPRPLSQEAIHFFDWLGRQQPLIFEPSDLFWPHTEQLVHSFSAAPEAQRGLLPLLAALAVSGNRCEVPQEVLRLCREWDDRSQDDAILLSLARGNCTTEEVNELAERIALNKSNYHILWRAFRILRRFPMERAASFGLAILKQFPTPGQDQNQLAVSILTEYLNNRPRCLGDADVRRRLNLPEPV